jgi:hypothetical protein
MFFNKIKDFLTKRIVKKRLSNVIHVASGSSIKKVGIVFDETYFYEKEDLIKQLILNGIKEQDISILVFKNAKRMRFWIIRFLVIKTLVGWQLLIKKRLMIS